jgi:2-oxoglutarate dehydrogenase E1 component
VLCSGKVYVDLAGSDQRITADDLTVARLEQLYPFPADDLQAIFKRFKNLHELIWAQEEPANMGAWEYVRDLLLQILPEGVNLRCATRPPSSSPAEGSAAWYGHNQRELINTAFGIEVNQGQPEGEEQASYKGVTG